MLKQFLMARDFWKLSVFPSWKHNRCGGKCETLYVCLVLSLNAIKLMKGREKYQLRERKDAWKHITNHRFLCLFLVFYNQNTEEMQTNCFELFWTKKIIDEFSVLVLCYFSSLTWTCFSFLVQIGMANSMTKTICMATMSRKICSTTFFYCSWKSVGTAGMFL